MPLAVKVRDYYRGIGANPRPGVSARDLTQFEERHGLSLPRAVSDFYLTFDGVGAHILDLMFFDSWPLAELGRVPDTVASFRGIPDYGPIANVLPDSNEYVAFGDGMVWSHVLAFRLNPGSTDSGPVVWISGARYAKVADTYSEFWELYLANAAAVLWPHVA